MRVLHLISIVTASLAHLLAPASAQEANDLAIRQATVRIRAIVRGADLTSPWRKTDVVSRSGSGLWLGSGRILTNSHVVRYASQITVTPFESSQRIPARVVARAPEIDLALLRIDETEAFSEVKAPSFQAKLPASKAAIDVYGYPTGGVTQSVTQGIVSRVEYASYRYGNHGLRIQVDAAINSGNSGGPAIGQDKVVGLVYSRLRPADNIGYLIPAQEIALFLRDVADGKYDGKPKLLDYVQTLQNDAARDQINLPETVTGVLVTQPYREDPDYPLRAGDVITQIGTRNIDNAGFVALSSRTRLPFRYFVAHLAKQNRVPITIWREGQQQSIELPVFGRRDMLIDYLRDDYPRYFLYGPLVFTPAYQDYLEGIDAKMVNSSATQRSQGRLIYRTMVQRRSPLVLRRLDKPSFAGEELVMICRGLLPHSMSVGYRSPQAEIIASVNGQPVKNLAHLVHILRELESEFVRFQMQDDNVQVLVYRRQPLLDAIPQIMDETGIVRQGSPDLMAIWNGEQDYSASAETDTP